MAPPIVVQNGATYASPSSGALPDGVVVVREGIIAAVGPRASIDIPRGAEIIDATGGVVLAGFQNSHVHFTEPAWAWPAAQPAETLTGQMREMLLRWGFTTVVDTGSLPDDTLALRRRIEAGEIDGPRIVTAGIPLYPPDGIPYYVREGLPPALLPLLPQPRTGSDAARVVTGSLSEAHLQRAVERNVAMVPTLTLFRGEPEVVAEVRDFHRRGGQLLFGTDVGYHDTYDTTREFDLLAQAGLSWRDVLAMLTANPAGKFREGQARGVIAPGMGGRVIPNPTNLRSPSDPPFLRVKTSPCPPPPPRATPPSPAESPRPSARR